MLKDRLSKTSGWQFYKWLFGPKKLSGLFRNGPQLTPVVQKVDNAIHRINHYPLDSAIDFAITYPLDSDLSGGQRYPSFEQVRPGISLV